MLLDKQTCRNESFFFLFVRLEIVIEIHEKRATLTYRDYVIMLMQKMVFFRFNKVDPVDH